jgi:hypothetical protein
MTKQTLLPAVGKLECQVKILSNCLVDGRSYGRSARASPE